MKMLDRLRELHGAIAEAVTLRAERDALAKRVGELEAHIRTWPSLECPCCGEEGAFAKYFEDGQATTCGCGGTVMADGDAYITIEDTEECPKCNPTPPPETTP